MGWLVALAVVVFLWYLPINLKVRYNANGILARLLLGPIQLWTYPEKKKENKKPQEKRNQSDSKKTEGGDLSEFFTTVKFALDFLNRLRKKIRVKRLELMVTMAGDDPYDVAVNYGRVWIALGNLLPYLEQAFVIKKRKIEVLCDFESAETKISGSLDCTIPLGRLLCFLIKHSIRDISKNTKTNNTRKGGMNNESKSS